jgi:phosphoglycerate dehydrogenase-like enzyme
MKILFTIPVTDVQKTRFEKIAPGKICFIPRDQVQKEDVQDAEVILGNISPEMAAEAEKLKWMQLSSAGADAYVQIPGDFILTNAAGAYGPAVSEFMLACTLAGLKMLDRYDQQQAVNEWHNIGSVRTMDQVHALVLGMGDIGSAYAIRMTALGAHVDGVRRTRKAMPNGFEKQYLPADLDAILPRYDVIAMALPETSETRHVMNKARLALCRPDAVLINVGRGSAIDETALLNALQAGRFQAAYLDVFAQEPLPQNNPLWHAPRLHVTPHIAGRCNADTTIGLVLNLVERNLHHYLNQEPLDNVVDRKRGY